MQEKKYIMKTAIKLSLLAACLLFSAINSVAQTDSEVSITGILQKHGTEKLYFSGEYSIQAKRDNEGQINYSDERALESLVGREVVIKGRKLSEKNIELIEINDVIYKSEESDYPIISQTGKTIVDFLPSNWTILQNAVGDINGDNLDDAVLVIKGNEQKFINVYQFDTRGNVQWLTNPITGASFTGYDANPRILLVLLKERSGYKLFLQNNSFITLPQFPVGETLESIKIENEILKVKFKWSDNHWVYGNSTHYFKFQKSEIILARYEILAMRTAGYGEFKDYDFKNKTVKKTKIEKQKETKVVEEKRIKPDKPFNLKDLNYIGDIEEI